MRELEREAETLKAILDKTGNKKVGETEAYSKLGAEIKTVEESIEQLTKKQQEWVNMGFSPDSMGIKEIDDQISELLGRIDELEAKRSELEASGGAFVLGDSTAEFDKMNQYHSN